MLRRTSSSVTATIANGASLSDVIEVGSAAMLLIHMPAAWTAASIGFHVSQSRGGTFIPLYDADGALIQCVTPAVSTAAVAPAEVAAARFVKLWSQNAGVDENQGAARSIGVDLKS